MKLQISWINKNSLVFSHQFKVGQIIDSTKLRNEGWILQKHINDYKAILHLLDGIANFILLEDVEQNNKSETMNKYTCDYHIFGVEEGDKTVEAKDIFEALALCNLYLWDYSCGVRYEIKNIYLIDTYPQMD